MIVLVLLVLGLILGSFVNALVWRMHEQDRLRDELEGYGPDGKKRARPSAARRAKLQMQLHTLSMTKGRSMCSRCRHPLAAKDLVPLFSWLWLRGRCRYCRQAIADPPLVEVITPALFAASYLLWPVELAGYGLAAFIFWLLTLVAFVALSLYDIRWFLLPDRIVWPLVALWVVATLIQATAYGGGWGTVTSAAWGVAIASGVFGVLYAVAERLGKQWIGFGDVKLGLVLGLIVGGPLQAILLLYLASLLGLLASLPALLRRRMGRNSVIPFGPFLMAACIIVVLFGGRFANWLQNWAMI